MKKLVYLALFLISGFSVLAQTELSAKVKQLIREKHPELDLNNKLTGFVIWSTNDNESRELNKSFDKTIQVYKNAKLKGGSKGIVILSVNKENLSSEAEIILKKDGINELISISLKEFEALDLQSTQNCVFDSAGMEVYRNLNSSDVYSSINKLITR